MSKSLKKNFSIEKNYREFNKIDKSWANFFYNNLKKKYKVEKDYPNLNSHMLKDNEHLIYLKKKIDRFKPNIIFVAIENEEIDKLIEKYKKQKKIIWISHKINDEKISHLKKYYDCLMTDNDFLISKAKKKRFKSIKMLISSPTQIFLKKSQYFGRKDSIYFSGSLGNDFKRRFMYLNYLAQNYKLKLRIRNLVEKYKILNYLNKFLLKCFPNFTSLLFKKQILPFTNKLKYINEDEIFGQKMLKELSNHKFCVNIHSDFDENNSINSRVFEALSSGCLLFTDKNLAMQKIFKNNQHVVYFDSFKDLKSKIDYYINNFSASYKVANQGNNEFIKKHQSKIRIKQFIKILESKI